VAASSAIYDGPAEERIGANSAGAGRPLAPPGPAPELSKAMPGRAPRRPYLAFAIVAPLGGRKCNLMW